VAVADIKYKSLSGQQSPEADVYQLLAYCTALRLGEGHLIYAHGEATPTTHVIGAAATRIIVTTVNLDQPPSPLLADLDRLASRIASPPHQVPPLAATG
jgi:5-methylcytosine-specific restriction enzyme subunit McrC